MVSATTVPGVKLHALEMWGDSANKDVFSKAFADSYRDFRKYALRALSDAGYLDHLLNDLPSGTALREMNSHGAATGLAIAIAIAGAAGAAANAAGTRARARETNDEESQSNLPTIDDVKALALSLVKRMIHLGDVADLLEDLLPGGGNVLQLFISLDNRYVPIDLEAQRLARQRFHNWVWDPGDEFYRPSSTMRKGHERGGHHRRRNPFEARYVDYHQACACEVFSSDAAACGFRRARRWTMRGQRCYRWRGLGGNG